MEDVPFVRFEENGEEINLYFKICDRLADYVRKNTNYCEKAFSLYLDNENALSSRMHAVTMLKHFGPRVGKGQPSTSYAY